MTSLAEAESAIDTRKYRLAVNLFRALVAAEPEDPIAYQGLARALLYVKDYDEAIAACRKALELNPSLSLAHVTMAAAHYGKKNLDAFRAEAQEAYKLDPTSADVLTCQGVMLLLDRRVDAAIESLGEAIRVNPTDVVAHRNLAYAFEVVGQRAKALHEARRVFALDPSLRSGLRLLWAFHAAYSYLFGGLLAVFVFLALLLHSPYFLVPLWIYGLAMLWLSLRLILLRKWRQGLTSLAYVAILAMISYAVRTFTR